jgi:mRNA interferase RelE/StbE
MEALSYRLVFKQSVIRDISRLPAQVQQRLRSAFAALEEDPLHARSGLDIRRLAGGPGWRLRVGTYRVTYVVEGDVIRILEAGSRENFY